MIYEMGGGLHRYLVSGRTNCLSMLLLSCVFVVVSSQTCMYTPNGGILKHSREQSTTAAIWIVAAGLLESLRFVQALFPALVVWAPCLPCQRARPQLGVARFSDNNMSKRPLQIARMGHRALRRVQEARKSSPNHRSVATHAVLSPASII